MKQNKAIIYDITSIQHFDEWGVHCQEEDWQMTLVSTKSRKLVMLFSLGMQCSKWESNGLLIHGCCM